MKKIVYVILTFILLYSVTAQLNVYLDFTGVSCNDSIQNGNETGVDCGGPCPACPSCVDGIQNQGETGVDCGGPCSSCDTGEGGSGGGFGGGSVVIEQNDSEDSFTKYFFFIKENSTLIFDINKSDLAIYNAEIKINNNLNNITFGIENRDNNLEVDEQEFSYQNYQYFKISATNMQTKDIDYVNIWYKISKLWVDEQEVAFEDFFLLNYKDNWEKLKTEFIKEDNNFYYFKSTVFNLGYFSITGKETEVVIIEEPETTENPFKRFIEQPTQIFKSDAEGNQNFKLIALTVMILAMVGSLVLLITRRSTEPTFVKREINLFKKKDNLEKYEERLKDIERRLKKI